MYGGKCPSAGGRVDGCRGRARRCSTDSRHRLPPPFLSLVSHLLDSSFAAMPVVLSDSDSDIEFIPAPSSSSKKASGSAGAASSSRANAAASSSSAQSPRKKAALPSSTAKGKKAAADLDEDMVARIRNEIKSDAPKRQEKSDKQKAACVPSYRGSSALSSSPSHANHRTCSLSISLSQAAWVKRQKEGPPPGSAPAAPGSKEIPEGEANCLAGLKFVFTGELSSLSREEATELAKRYGGCVARLPFLLEHDGVLHQVPRHDRPDLSVACFRPARTVTGAPSGVTSFVVVGANAGASKLRRIAEKNVPTIDEDGFLDLIRTRGSGKLDDKQRKKLKEEEAKIKRVAAEMEEAEREADRKRQKLERQAEKERQAREQEALAAQASGSGRSKSKPVVQARPAAPTYVRARSYLCDFRGVSLTYKPVLIPPAKRLRQRARSSGRPNMHRRRSHRSAATRRRSRS